MALLLFGEYAEIAAKIQKDPVQPLRRRLCWFPVAFLGHCLAGDEVLKSSWLQSPAGVAVLILVWERP